jgi:hypothetical protein
MRLYASIFFLTLVVSGLAASAAPTYSNEPAAIELSPKEKSEPIFSSSEKTERNWSVRAGFLGGALKETNQSAQLYFYGLRYDFLREPLSTWEIEATTAKDNFVHLVAGKKFYFPFEDVAMPYYKFAVGDLIDSTDGLGSIFNLKKMQAMAMVGLDDLFQWDQRLQAEIGVSYALIGPQFEMSLGFAF